MMKPSKPIIVLLIAVMILNLFAAVPFTANGAEVNMGSSSGTDEDFSYSIIDGTARIYGYSGTASNVVIPSTLDGYPVTELGEETFTDNDNLYSVTIPDTVIEIGGDGTGWAYENKSYTSTELPTEPDDPYPVDEVTVTVTYQIKVAGCFAGCNNLRTVNFGSGLKHIGECAFADCDSLVNITIPEKVTSIESGAFSCCDSLQNVEILGPANLYYNEYLGMLNFYEEVDSDYTHYVYNYVEIPCEIGYARGVFQNCNKLENVSFSYSGSAEYSWENIGKDSFCGCNSLTSVNIPNYVTGIGEDAFYGCRSLTSVTIPESVTYIGNWAFAYCTGLTSVELNCPVIPSYMFAECKSLKSVTLGNSVTSVGEKAFHGCTSLKSIIVPNSVKHIGDKTFGFYYDVVGSQTHSTQLKGFRIYGYRNTVGELYATENNFLFTALDEEPEKKTGDADGDGEVTLMDATVLQGFFASIITDLNEEDLMAADIDKNGLLEIIDVTFIQRYAAEMEIPYEIG